MVEIRKRVKGDNSSISAVPENDSQNRDLPGQDLSNATATESALVPGVPGRAGGDSERPLPTHVSKFRLVLDAGHGGWDLGTVGRTGLMEKDLVLDIVARLGKLVESRLGAEVIFTRDSDTYLPLEKRTEIANLAQADMFVSVHANYSEDSSARGAETYYTNTYSSVRARTADAEAAVPENINWNNVDIREKVQQSRRFARCSPAGNVSRSGNTDSRHPQPWRQESFLRGADGNFDASDSRRSLLRQQSGGRRQAQELELSPEHR